MRISVLLAVAGAAALITGCAGPEQKLGRGINNVTEFVRFGELNRSIEQTALWDGPATAFTTGFIRGLNRGVLRTALGAYEVATFPLPPYKPLLTPPYKLYPDPSIKTSSFPFGGLWLSENPVYPDSGTPNLLADQLFATDMSLGYSGGDIAPFVVGSRFRIFDN